MGDLKPIVIVGTMDTKAEEINFVKDQLQNKGCRAIVLDLSVGSKPLFSGDISSEEVVIAGGGDPREIYGNPDRVKINKIITEGAIIKVNELYKEGNLGGILGIGGTGGTLMCTNVMKSLPFGVPKLMVSSNAAARGFSERYFGTKDITMMHTVIDIAGVSDMLKILLIQAAGAIKGMVESYQQQNNLAMREKPSIAVCELMIDAETVAKLRHSLEDLGYQVSVFMATGVGDVAMEELIAERLFDAVIDLAPGGIIDGLIGGTRATPANRLETAGKIGIPQIIAPGGLDFIAPQKSKYLPEYENRKKYEPDAFRRLLRSNAKELTETAKIIAEKLNKSTGQVKFMVPLQGWSTIDGPGKPLEDPEANSVFVNELKKHLSPEIEIQEIDARINDPEFVSIVVNNIDYLIKNSVKSTTELMTDALKGFD
ncbi:MAG: Tm-1-like ATP-binding domain-containing protein [Thermincola sp.]|jgi:uncharacterized protein (UPF0261 family)|nr:Tm-1-like ATP-binding domain-containing protein [Thermincola sp.]MDT3702653.1 Tm-1-like ATP-binding domain-containing protein [Thermincola sp.]